MAATVRGGAAIMRWLSATMRCAIIERRCGHTVKVRNSQKTADTTPHLRDVPRSKLSRTAIEPPGLRAGGRGVGLNGRQGGSWALPYGRRGDPQWPFLWPVSLWIWAGLFVAGGLPSLATCCHGSPLRLARLMTHDWGCCATGLSYRREIWADRRFSTHLSTNAPFSPIREACRSGRAARRPVATNRFT